MKYNTGNLFEKASTYSINDLNVSKTIKEINELGAELARELDGLLPAILYDWDVEKIYIPILRGLRPIQTEKGVIKAFDNTEDNYKHRTIKDYFDGGHIIRDQDIFTGLNLYNDIRNHLLNNRDKRNQIKDFEDFLSQTFFFGESVSLIPHIENDVLKIGIGKEEERAIYDMGDGIQSIIIMLYPLFLNQDKNLMVFIEEPELSLHPGMQRIFIETLLRPEFKNFQYFITTHSNHFLDITLDLKSISIYTFKKKNNKDSKPSYVIQNSNNDDIQILDLIGARNSSVFLSNCTIWVEGITDRLYLRKYLEVYLNSLIESKEIKDRYKEDIHFSFIEYGGGNIVHWSFSDADAWDKIKTSSISKKIFLMADQDDTVNKPGSEKAKRMALLKNNLGDNFRPVLAREIENTLSPNVIINTVKELHTGKSAVDFSEKDITFEKYKDKKLGLFIESKFKNVTKNYAAKSGTINDKVNFCQTAITKIKTVEDLSTEGLALAKDIYEFIKKSNQ